MKPPPSSSPAKTRTGASTAAASSPAFSPLTSTLSHSSSRSVFSFREATRETLEVGASKEGVEGAMGGPQGDRAGGVDEGDEVEDLTGERTDAVHQPVEKSMEEGRVAFPETPRSESTGQVTVAAQKREEAEGRPDSRDHSERPESGGTAGDDQTGDKRKKESSQIQDQTNLLPTKQIITVFMALSLALLCSLLDQTIVSTALPKIASAFHQGQDSAWVGTSYLVTSTAFQPLYGRFSDIFGRKSVMIFALVMFLIGSALCAAAQTMTQLIAFRAIAGIGGGGIVTLVMTIVSDVVSLRERGKYQGILGSVVAISNSVGPLLGGVLSEASWRWCFIISVPLTLLATAVIVFLLPLKRVKGDAKGKLVKVDWWGTFLILAATILILLPLNWGGTTYPWSSAHVLSTLIIGCVLMIVFCLVEWKLVSLPIMPMHLFKNVTICSVMIQTLMNGIVQYCLLYFVPQFYQVVRGYSGVLAGVMLLPLMFTQSICSTIAGIVVSQTGRYKAIILTGFVLFTLAVGLLGLLEPSSPVGQGIGFLLIAGVGVGGTLQTTLIAAQAVVERKDMAVVTALRNFIRLLGGTISLAICFAILNNSLLSNLRGLGLDDGTISAVLNDPTVVYSRLNVDAATRSAIIDAYTKGFHNVFYFATAACGVALVSILLGVRETSLSRDDEEELKARGKEWAEKQKEKRRNRRSAANTPLSATRPGTPMASPDGSPATEDPSQTALPTPPSSRRPER